ncbi:diacylglycerol kinase family protein [Lactobacillus sp. CC-MHH1034]|uniref:diacylglycerol kinase family protein n=1 Tax=Agrilactobacillus fermenti TaxID=2586909 RepID=UPI001E4C75B9|nr:diacylglycerol kinase family protein [Agrilactobacillus fermenti]MCD2255813.1 diacylglycerol kinase family protein [Agrilactobacillus fermenti]
MVSHDKPHKPQTDKNHTFWQSLKHATRGVHFAIAHEKNLRRDVSFTIIVFVVAYLLKLSRYDFLWLALMVFLVIQAELWNSVAEYLVDLTTKHQYDYLAKIIKDLSAGIVLLTATFATVIGAIIFIPALWHLFFA